MVENDMRRICTFSVALFLFAPCISALGQKSARTLELNTLELNEENYDTICKALECSKDELGWREIAWHPNLGKAIVEVTYSQPLYHSK